MEEAFKRLKHRLSLEHVAGLSRQALAQDLVAKVVCEILQGMTALTAHDRADLPMSTDINKRPRNKNVRTSCGYVRHRSRPIPTSSFGLIEGLIRAPQQRFGIAAVVGKDGHPKRYGDGADMLTIMLDLTLRDGRANLLGPRACDLQRSTRHDDGELFTAHSEYNIGTANVLHKDTSDGNQHLVPDFVAECIVDALEMVNVSRDHAQSPVLSSRHH
jgi:hypothetical protein